MKKNIAIATVIAGLIVPSIAGIIVVENLDDGINVMPATHGGKSVNKVGLPTINSFSVIGREEGVRISSLCATTSTNMVQSRKYTMAGLVGQNVPTDRVSDPSAWYSIPFKGWQLWDGIQTTFNSRFGTTIMATSENGHRMVIHVSGKYPVGNYRCRITSSVTNYTSIYIEFPVGTNTSGNEIAFNANFVGISFGANGVLESSINPVTGAWTQGGDDRVYSNGEFPSTVLYDWWYRFGSTLAISINHTDGFEPLKGEFASQVPTLKVELMTPDRVVASRTIEAARASIGIVRDDGQIRLSVLGGQTLLHYVLQGKETVSSIWENYHGGAYFISGQKWIEPTHHWKHGFFRLILAK